jgi:hypothetical protein
MVLNIGMKTVNSTVLKLDEYYFSSNDNFFTGSFEDTTGLVEKCDTLVQLILDGVPTGLSNILVTDPNGVTTTLTCFEEEFDEELMRKLTVESDKLEDRFNQMQAHGIIDPDEEKFVSNKFIREQWELEKTIQRKREVEREILEYVEVYDAGVYDEIVMVVDSNGKVTYQKVSSLV